MLDTKGQEVAERRSRRRQQSNYSINLRSVPFVGLCCTIQYVITVDAENINLPGLFNPLKAELNPICHLLALLGAHHILLVSKVRVN